MLVYRGLNSKSPGLVHVATGFACKGLFQLGRAESSGLKFAAVLPQDHTLALSSLDGAAQRLREAISFSRGDPQPHNALGDTLMACADLAGNPSEALGFLNASLQEGYSAALRLISQDANADVGSAEVLLPPCPL